MNKEELEKWYHYELKRRDKQIDELKQQNKVLMGMIQKQAAKSTQVSAHAKDLIDINKKLKEKVKNLP